MMQIISEYNRPIPAATYDRVWPNARCAFLLSAPSSFEDAIQFILNYIAKLRPDLPSKASFARDIRLDDGPITFETTGIESPEGRIWAAHLVTGAVPAERIVTEFYLAEAKTGALMGRCFVGMRRLVQATKAPVAVEQFDLVQKLIERFGAEADENILTPYWIKVSEPSFFDRLIRLIGDPERVLPVVVIARDWQREAVDADIAGNILAGAAHLWRLRLPWPGRLSETLGFRPGVALGDVMLFKPGFRFRDPGAFLNRFQRWSIKDDMPLQQQHEDNLDALVQSCFAAGFSLPEADDFPRYSRIAALSTRGGAKHLNPPASLPAPAPQAEIAELSSPKPAPEQAPEVKQSDQTYAQEDAAPKALREELDAQKQEYDALLDIAESERKAALEEAESARVEAARLRSRLAWLEQMVNAREKAGPVDEPLTDLSLFDEWADKHLAGTVWISPKARKATRESIFENPTALGEALLALRDQMVPMRREGGIELKRAFDERMAELHIDDQPCFGQKDSIKAYPEYQTTYNGDTYWCYNHLRYGKGYDPRYMFRIYYTWHEADQILLIGHMPTHLDNKATS